MTVVVCVRVSEYVSVSRGMFNHDWFTCWQCLCSFVFLRQFLAANAFSRQFWEISFDSISKIFSVLREPVELRWIQSLWVPHKDCRTYIVQRSAMGSDLIKCHIVTLNQQSSDLFVSVGDMDAWCRCVCVCRMAVWRRIWHWSFVAIFVDYNWICSCTRTPHTSQRPNAIHYNCCLV